MKTTLTKVSNSLPAPVVTFIQVVVSVGISYLVAWITTAVPHIHGPWVVIYGAAVALYYSAVAAAERKWPSWAWLLYLLPSNLPPNSSIQGPIPTTPKGL